ncbi:MAG: hypothetical protein WCP18_03835 [bacterium]
MLSAIALMPILGKPAIMYGGIITLLLLLMTAFIGYRINKGTCKFKNPIKMHQLFALIVVILGLGHAILGLAIMFGF